MNNAISSLRILPADFDSSAASLGSAPSSGFRNVLDSAIGDLETVESQANAKVAGVLSGQGEDVHSAMIAVEKADLSFQLMMQVRNKIVSAYEEISRMQF